MSIRLYYDEISFRYRGWKKIRNLIQEIISAADMKPGDISIIITNDVKLRIINIEFLEHDYFTDVITFNYNEGKKVNGEIYISLDTVRENSQNYKISLQKELNRVVIHGILHLLGWDDQNEIQKAKMRTLEDKWLNTLAEQK